MSVEGDRKLGESAELIVWCLALEDVKSANSNIKYQAFFIIVFLSFFLSSSLISSFAFCLLFHFPQTNIGSILAAVNPYKQISGLYDGTAVDLYSKHQMGELPPHIFAVANECYRCLWKRHDSQCVLIRWGSTFKEKVSCYYQIIGSSMKLVHTMDKLSYDLQDILKLNSS